MQTLNIKSIQSKATTFTIDSVGRETLNHCAKPLPSNAAMRFCMMRLCWDIQRGKAYTYRSILNRKVHKAVKDCEIGKHYPLFNVPVSALFKIQVN